MKKDLFTDRQKSAETSRARLLEKFKSRPPEDDPAMIAKAAERKAVADARAARQAVKDQELEAKRAALAAEAAEKERLRQEAQAAEEARLQAEAEAKLQASRERASRVVADEAARKAQRDARYAARKARK